MKKFTLQLRYNKLFSFQAESCKEMGAEPGRRFLIQPAAKLESVIVAFDKKRRIPAAGASTEVKWTSIKKL